MLLNHDEISQIGFAQVGSEVRITRYALFFNPQYIRLGDRVRIDAFAVIAAGDEGVFVGNNVHLSSGSLVNGSGGKVVFEDFSGIAPKVCIWTASDDYTKGSLTGGTIPFEFKADNRTGPVTLGRHVIVGNSSVILPRVHIHDGAAVGALSLVTRDVPSGHVVSGVPARRVAERPLDRLLSEELRYLSAILKT